jgi:hypothetical protein
MVFIYLAVVLVVGAIGMFVRKLYLKRQLERGLGREVDDSELTSIAAWMGAGPPPRKSSVYGNDKGRSTR